jgi:iron(III) transport system substrate-binding protein
VAAAAALLAAGCSGAGRSSGSDGPLVVYNGQHESTTKLLVRDFTEATGIKVKVKGGSDGELANEIVKEGSASPRTCSTPRTRPR